MIDIRLLQPTHLLYESLGEPTIKDIEKVEEDTTCPLCGIKGNEIVNWKIPIKFSDLDIFAEKENIKHLCPACMYALSHIKDLHKAYILTKKDGFTLIQFDDQPDKKIGIGKKKIVSRYYLKEWLLNPPLNDPWILMLQSRMNPRHSLMKAKVNYGDSDILWVSDGGNNYAIPREGLEELFNSLEIVKKSNSLYPYLFIEKSPQKNHKEIELWKEVEPIIYKHRHKHYLPFIYDRIIPPKKYMLEHLNEGSNTSD